MIEWRDFRFPWAARDWALSELIVGPGCVVFLPSVKQN